MAGENTAANYADLFACSSITDVCINEALPGVLGIQVEGLFIFRDLGRRVIYFQGFGEKA